MQTTSDFLTVDAPTERPAPPPARSAAPAATMRDDDRTERPAVSLAPRQTMPDPLAKLRSRVSSLLTKDQDARPQPGQHQIQLTEQQTAPAAPELRMCNYVAAKRIAGSKLAWMCNYKHALHSGPTGCAHPELGGKWVVVDKDNIKHIKDD